MTSGNVEAKGDIDARDIITGIQQNFFAIFQQPFKPPVDLAQLRSDYLAYLRDSYRHLDMKGIMQVQQVTQQLPLAAIYVPLMAYTNRAGPGEVMGRVAGRHLHLAGKTEAGPDRAEVLLSRQTTPQPIEEILKGEPAVVVLGDPGAGKSTLLKVIALALAEQDDGPLPIILPLNAYARRLQQGEINLCLFLGQYYATRQHKLSQVGSLFEAALNDKQAVVLLDGLDEVQADRPYLVRLVQDFVAEYMLHPAEGDEPLPGNRIVVTSRIVGYDDAPLTGPQWRSHTLTDFNRKDIEQFVKQWTLLFAISVQGDSEPARQAAKQEQQELLESIFSRPSVERLAANPLLLTILALIKYTGVTLPEQRVKLYELYLQALIESWNRARSLDQYPVGPGMNYEETVQVLAPLALWLRRENPTAGLVSRERLEQWLTAYYHGEEWGLPKGEARQRGRNFIDSVERYSNLLLERGERQYGFLHLTLEEMLAAKGLAQLYFDEPALALEIMGCYLADPGWHETLQLAVGAMGVLKQQPRQAGAILQKILQMAPPETEPGYAVTFAGRVLLDVTPTGVGRVAAQKVTAALVETMQSAACPIRIRREAGHTLGRLGWTPTPAPDDLILAPPGVEPTGLDAFRPAQTPDGPIWIGKYPVTNAQFDRFMQAGGYDNRHFWSDEGWAWRTGTYDSKAPDYLQDWLKNRPAEKRNRPYYWAEQKWNSPLLPVVGVSWFEAEAYSRWLTAQFQGSSFEFRLWREDEWVTLAQVGDLSPTLAALKATIVNNQAPIEARLPLETEWEAAMSGQGDYPWGDAFDFNNLNCAESWIGRKFEDNEEWRKWLGSDEESWREATTTAVTTYPQGVSPAGIWDGSGNVWEWMFNPYSSDGDTKALRGGGWVNIGRNARVSSRFDVLPDDFNFNFSFRVIVAPVIL